MKNPIQRFYEFLELPIFPYGRVALAAAVVPLALSMMWPLWRISLEAPQYPKGLYMEIYANRIEGGNDGQHLQEINTLNHYIGMQPLDQDAIPDLDWMPFALGMLGLLALRSAAIGTVRSLIDMSVVTLYVLGFMGARFVYRLYSFGHDLAPDAPMTVDPFMPAVIGTKQIANFTTHSMPQLGTVLVSLFALGIWATTLWHLVAGRLAAQRSESQAPR